MAHDTPSEERLQDKANDEADEAVHPTPDSAATGLPEDNMMTQNQNAREQWLLTKLNEISEQLQDIRKEVQDIRQENQSVRQSLRVSEQNIYARMSNGRLCDCDQQLASIIDSHTGQPYPNQLATMRSLREMSPEALDELLRCVGIAPEDSLEGRHWQWGIFVGVYSG